ncbi:MAG: M23 family metallopeptidase [Bryobacteraceae bacterium]
MKHRCITIPGLLFLLVAYSPQSFAARKRTPKKVTATNTGSENSGKKQKAARSKKKQSAPIPVRPQAEIPAVTEASSVWQGCLGSDDLPDLASRLGMEESSLNSVLNEEGVLATEGQPCVRYVAATGGENGVASATFLRPESKEDKSPVLAVRKTTEGIVVTPGACDCPEASRRTLILPAADVSNPSSDVMGSLPKSARWQLTVLVPQMIQRVGAKQASAEAPSQDAVFMPAVNDTSAHAVRSREASFEQSAPDFLVRVIVESHHDAEPEHLQSVELIDFNTNVRMDGAWWLEREGRPGVFIGMDGLAYERGLWLSPVKYSYTSRGVGPAVTTFRSRIKLPKFLGGKGKEEKAEKPKTEVRQVKIRGLHLGLDMLAPKGYEVHAVSNATVAFSGRQGGYGNLIILDHGMGYQTYYAHLSRIEPGVKPGAKVVAGEVIGLVGSTGRSTAPHLHFETRKDKVYLDPVDDTRQLEFWVLSADDQERLAMQLLTPAMAAARDDASAASQPQSTAPLSAAGNSGDSFSAIP